MTEESRIKYIYSALRKRGYSKLKAKKMSKDYVIAEKALKKM